MGHNECGSDKGGCTKREVRCDGRGLGGTKLPSRTERITAVDRACVMRKAPYVFPVTGKRKVDHLSKRLGVAYFQIKGLIPFDGGFGIHSRGKVANQRAGHSGNGNHDNLRSFWKGILLASRNCLTR